jgi:hypothetical protein
MPLPHKTKLTNSRPSIAIRPGYLCAGWAQLEGRVHEWEGSVECLKHRQHLTVFVIFDFRDCLGHGGP